MFNEIIGISLKSLHLLNAQKFNQDIIRQQISQMLCSWIINKLLNFFCHNTMKTLLYTQNNKGLLPESWINQRRENKKHNMNRLSTHGLTNNILVQDMSICPLQASFSCSIWKCMTLNITPQSFILSDKSFHIDIFKTSTILAFY